MPLSGPVPTVVFAIAGLILTWIAGRMMVSSDGWTRPLAEIGKIAAVALAMALTVGAGQPLLLDMIRMILELGAEIGTTLLSHASGAVGSCWRTPVEPASAESWGSLDGALGRFIAMTTTTSAVLLGTARTFLPSGFGTGTLHAAANLFQLTNLDAILEMLRLVFAMAIAMAALTFLATVCLLVLEAVVSTALAVVLSPIAIGMALWRPTRGALLAVVQAVLGAALALAAAGLSLTITQWIIKHGLEIFTALIRNEEPPTG